jgi:hypothetical protein
VGKREELTLWIQSTLEVSGFLCIFILLILKIIYVPLDTPTGEYHEVN